MMEYAAGMFGLLTGSFLNVCISRLPDDYSVAGPRSQCPGCGQQIAAYDNIPVISFLLLRGRCRSCSLPISWRYPVVELLTAIFFFLAVRFNGWTWAGFKWCLLSAILVELIFSDLETRILPDEFTMSGIVAGLLLSPIVLVPEGAVSIIANARPPALASFADSLGGALLISGLLWMLGAAYMRIRGREGLGFGDVKLVALLGAFLGLESAILAVAASSLLGLLLGLAWVKLQGEDPSTYELPFGSFLGVGGLAMMCVQWMPGVT